MLVSMISSVPTAGVEPATSNRVTAGALPLRYVGVCQGIAAPRLIPGYPKRRFLCWLLPPSIPLHAATATKTSNDVTLPMPGIPDRVQTRLDHVALRLAQCNAPNTACARCRPRRGEFRLGNGASELSVAKRVCLHPFLPSADGNKHG